MADKENKMEKDYNGKFSPMSIAALVLSILFCTSIIGIILGIIDLTKKDGRKKGLSIAAVSVGGLFLLLSIVAAASGPSENKSTDSKTESVKEQVETPTPTPVEEHSKAGIAEEDNTETKGLDVTITPTAKWVGNSVKFSIETNLPDDTELILSLSTGDYNTDDTWTGESKVRIKNGKATSKGFSDKGKKLTGDYDLSVSMSIPSTQKETVRAVVGEKGEYLNGPLVEKGIDGESSYVSALFSVSLEDEIKIDSEDDYTHTVFREEDEEGEEGEDDDVTSETSDKIPDEEMINSLIALSKVVLNENFGDNYNISYEDNMVTINIWQEGITLGALGVQAGTVSKSTWKKMVDGVQSMSKSVYKNFEPYGVHVNVNVLNDVNKENTLLSFLDGVKFYDALEE